MENNVIYSTTAASLDSWDIENLKYLRKLSRFNCEESGTASYNTTVVSNICNNSDDDDEERDEMLRVENASERQLDNCYLIDVVTIRNESVLASRNSIFNNNNLVNNENFQKFDKFDKFDKLGSDGYESHSLLSTDSTSSSIEGQTFDENGPISFQESIMSSEFSKNNESRNSDCSNTISSCSICGSEDEETRKSFSIAPSPHFQLGQIEVEVDEEERRTPSPYYVRLRRDLYLHNFQSIHKQRTNFGIDQKGQLIIDYSPNWDGLEKFISALRTNN